MLRFMSIVPFYRVCAKKNETKSACFFVAQNPNLAAPRSGMSGPLVSGGSKQGCRAFTSGFNEKNWIHCRFRYIMFASLVWWEIILFNSAVKFRKERII